MPSIEAEAVTAHAQATQYNSFHNTVNRQLTSIIWYALVKRKTKKRKGGGGGGEEKIALGSRQRDLISASAVPHHADL